MIRGDSFNGSQRLHSSSLFGAPHPAPAAEKGRYIYPNPPYQGNRQQWTHPATTKWQPRAGTQLLFMQLGMKTLLPNRREHPEPAGAMSSQNMKCEARGHRFTICVRVLSILHRQKGPEVRWRWPKAVQAYYSVCGKYILYICRTLSLVYVRRAAWEGSLTFTAAVLTLKVLKDFGSIQPGAEAGQASVPDLFSALVCDHVAILLHDHQLWDGGDLVALLQLTVRHRTDAESRIRNAT